MTSKHEEAKWLNADEQDAWRRFMDGNGRLMDALNRNLQNEHGLALAEYRILVMLSEASDGSLRMSELADGVLSSRSRLTHQIRRMEDDGLVVRTSCPHDGRGVLATITDEGRRRLAAAAPSHVDDVRTNLIGLISPGELRTLGKIFARVDEALSGK